MSELPYDLIAIDLDGTLLNSNHAVSAENRDALRRAHEAGMHVVICTGRAYPETRPIIKQVGLDLNASIAVYGAVVTDVATGKTIDRVPIPMNTATAVVDWYQQQDYTVLWLTDSDEVGFDGYVINGPNRHPTIDFYLGLTSCEMQCVETLPDNACAPVRLSIVDNRETLIDVADRLKQTFDGQLTHNILTAPTWKLSLIEMFAPQVNKWAGIQKLCDRWNIDPKKTVAVGDDVNDIEMLKHAGLGVAMGNGRDAVKAVADRQTLHHNEHGVAAVIHELLDA